MLKRTSRMMLLGMTAALAASGCSSNSDSQNSSSASPSGGNPSAASSASASTQSDASTPIELTMMGPKQSIQGPWEDMDFFKEMEKRTNIHFKFDTPPITSYQEKKNLAFASGDLPDVLFAAQLTPSEEVNYGKQGLIVPLEDLIERHAPNIKKLLDDNPAVRKSITTTDGHIYALPQVTELAHNLINKTWINGAWMKNVGADQAPKTTEELYALLKAFKEKDANQNGKNDEIPLSGINIDSIRPFILSAFGYLSNYSVLSNQLDVVQVIDDKVVYVPTTEGYKQYLIYMNKLYKEQLLDNEIFSQTSEQFTAKGKENRIGVFPSAAPFLVLDIKTDEENFQNPVLPALTSAFNATPTYLLNNGTSRGTFAITKKDKYPERTIAWIDYLYTQEGGILANSGVEGKGWKWVDAEKTKWERLAVDGKNIEESRAMNAPDPGLVIPTFKGKDFHYKINNPVTQWLHKTSEPFLAIAKTPYPLVYFSDDEQKRMNVLTTDLTTYVSQSEAKFILSKDVEAGWDEYVKTIENMNVNELLSIYQAAYDRWNQSK
ncbi:extracellular solute-binding protein [Cohnella sp. GCM10012308]|uniref:extracellular solute-binding protein n=1 Tax=Cohnella sp. GCM10012308 TaxID=3317329 RepID=UPI003614F43E